MRAATVLLAMTIFSSTVACSKKTPEPTKAVASMQSPLLPAAQAAAKAVAADGKLNPNDPKHGTRKLMGLDAPVFVDGIQVAVFRNGELPPVPPRVTETGAMRWNLYTYLKGIGVDVDNLKSIHFYGNNDRIASVEGSELRKEKSRFEFAFTSRDTGAPVQWWSGTGLKNEFIVHEMRRIGIYVKKPVPAIDMAKNCHTSADGECTGIMPYSDGTIAKGTRIYVDGKMAGYVKRRLVTDSMMVGAAAADPSENNYSVAKLLAGLNINLASIKSVEVMAGDDLIARATGERFNALAGATTFSLPAHNHGKVRFHIPGEFQAQAPGGVTDRDGLGSAVLVYTNTTPPADRNLVAISEETDTEVQVAAIDDGRPVTQGNGGGKQD
jgi:hypothetical protein